MRIALSFASAALGLSLLSGGVSAQIQPIQPNDPRLMPNTPSGDVLSKIPQPSRGAAPESKGPGRGDGLTRGKNGDPIGATDDPRACPSVMANLKPEPAMPALATAPQ